MVEDRYRRCLLSAAFLHRGQSSNSTPVSSCTTSNDQRNYSYWLFEGVRVQSTLPFELGNGLELVGVPLRVSLNPKERDRKCLFHFACHVLWSQREGEGHRVIMPCAISKVAQPVKSSLGANKFKLQIGLNMIIHDALR